jgi:transcriptional regulator with XRE-family HTH domain
VRRGLSPWLGMAIRERREARGLSQEGLAEKANLHRTYVSMVERATRNISVDALNGIADALGLRPSQLMRRAERLRAARSRRDAANSKGA